MGVFDQIKKLFGKKEIPETFEQKECRECKEAVLADINRYRKYVKEYSDQLDKYRIQGLGPGDPLFQSAFDDLQRFTYSLYEVEKMYKFIRENKPEDIAYRNKALSEFAVRVKELLPQNSILRFHGTPIYFAEEILKSGKISSSADRFDGYVRSTDMPGEISVSDANSLGRTVNYFLDVNAYLRCLPCGCLFVLDGEGQTDKQLAGSVMNSIDFKQDPNMLLAVISTPENMENLKDWLGKAGLSQELACSFDDFISELELTRQGGVRSPEPAVREGIYTMAEKSPIDSMIANARDLRESLTGNGCVIKGFER